jgi:hypothetical protein
MNDSRQNSAEDAKRRQLLLEFLGDAARDLERMRIIAIEIEAGEVSGWNQLRNLAHNIAARAGSLKLGVLNATARELERLADEQLAGTAPDHFLLQCAHSAIDTLALEMETLKKES